MDILDDLGVTWSFPRPPARVVSLVPSTTETVFDLGRGDALVGRTRFCERPEAARRAATVGGTKDVDVEAVLALAPDVVLANREENVAEQVAALAARVPVVVAASATVDDALRDLARTARLLGADATPWREAIVAARGALAPWRAAPVRGLCLIWRGPWMAVGGDTFVSSVLAEAGVINVLGDRVRYPEVTAEQIAALDPEVVVLPTEPFPFRARHAEELAAATGLPRERFVGADGQHLTWHGTRLARALPALEAARRQGWPSLI
jgi:ABC-type Fe3+-hydroxamate transport system substrate-binding protein